jgi:hypothetical protein
MNDLPGKALTLVMVVSLMVLLSLVAVGVTCLITGC